MDFINEFVYSCNEIAEDLYPTICKRAIRRMNNWSELISINGRKIKWEVFSALLDGGYPRNFNFFDILSIQIQNYGYDEINPYLRDAIEDVIEYEMDLLPSPDKLALEYSVIKFDRNEVCCDKEELIQRLFNYFHNMLNDHWSNSKKIQRYLYNVW